MFKILGDKKKILPHLIEFVTDANREFEKIHSPKFRKHVENARLGFVRKKAQRTVAAGLKKIPQVYLWYKEIDGGYELTTNFDFLPRTFVSVFMRSSKKCLKKHFKSKNIDVKIKT